MGLEKITFGWSMKKITWIAFVGYCRFYMEKAL
jgi:hypothetical protein